MITITELDKQILKIETWVPQAAAALLSLSGNAPLTFGTPGDSQQSHDDLTSATKTLWPLADFLRWAHENTISKRRPPHADEATNCVQNVADGWFTALYAVATATESGGDESKPESHIDIFNASYLLSSVALIDALQRAAPLHFEKEQIELVHRYACNSVATAMINELVEVRGARPAVNEKPQDFLTLHAIRSLDCLHDAVSGTIWDSGPGKSYTDNMLQRLADRVREDVLRQLGYRQAGAASRFDSAELVFSAALLSRLSAADIVQLAQPALRTALVSQTEDGAWPTVRLGEVPSLEVSHALVSTLARDVESGRFELVEALLPVLDRSLDLVAATHTISAVGRGWTNDRMRWTDHVELGPTARVLSFTVRYAEALRSLRQRLLLGVYRAKEPEPRLGWPDLERTYRVSPPMDEGALEDYSDPTGGQILTHKLRDEVLAPIRTDFVQRPHIASLIVHGPPGSRKTSLIGLLAKALQWPLVSLSPPTFLSRGGLNGFEEAADAVFRDLMRLRRAVVIFDECDEFFLSRRPSPPVSQSSLDEQAEEVESGESPGEVDVGQEERGYPGLEGDGDVDDRKAGQLGFQPRAVGAFITAGMLPRLQSLRDQRWILFVLATNSPLNELDPAVTRPGRFDYAVFVGHPVLKAQCRYIERMPSSDQASSAEGRSDHATSDTVLSDRAKQCLLGAVEGLASETLAGPISFGAIDSVARQLATKKLEAEKVKVSEELKRLAKSGPQTLY